MKPLSCLALLGALTFAASSPALAQSCDPVVIATENGPQTTSLCPDAPPPATPEQVQPAPTSIEIVSAVEPTARPLPARINTGAIWSAISELRRSRIELKEVPVKELTSDQLELIKKLEQIPNLEAALKALPKQGSVATATLPAPQQRAVQEVITTQSQVERSLGRTALDITTVLNALGLIALVILGSYGYRKLDGRINNHDARIEAVEDRFAVKVGKIKDGPYRTLLPAEIRAIPVGESFPYYLLVNDDRVCYQVAVYQLTDSGKDVTLVCEQLSKGAPSRKFHQTLCENIEKDGYARPEMKLYTMPAAA